MSFHKHRPSLSICLAECINWVLQVDPSAPLPPQTPKHLPRKFSSKATQDATTAQRSLSAAEDQLNMKQEQPVDVAQTGFILSLFLAHTLSAAEKKIARTVQINYLFLFCVQLVLSVAQTGLGRGCILLCLAQNLLGRCKSCRKGKISGGRAGVQLPQAPGVVDENDNSPLLLA